MFTAWKMPPEKLTLACASAPSPVLRTLLHASVMVIVPSAGSGDNLAPFRGVGGSSLSLLLAVWIGSFIVILGKEKADVNHYPLRIHLARL